MARMIPAIFDQETPPGERKVFLALKSGEESSDWIVLHSLFVGRIRGGMFSPKSLPQHQAEFAMAFAEARTDSFFV